MATQILVTGGGGYLGSVLCEVMPNAGYRITVVDNLMYSQHDGLAQRLARADFCGWSLKPNYVRMQ